MLDCGYAALEISDDIAENPWAEEIAGSMPINGVRINAS
jgi:hypothetical protein